MPKKVLIVNIAKQRFKDLRMKNLLTMPTKCLKNMAFLRISLARSTIHRRLREQDAKISLLKILEKLLVVETSY